MSQKERSLLSTYRKQGHPRTAFEGQGWEETGVSDTLNVYDNSEARTPTLILPPPSERNAVAIENHPNDSRAKITGNVVQALSGRMGTGGNNTPMVMEMEDDINARTQNPILCLLCKTYGTQEVFQWGIDVLGALQQTDVLRQGMYERGVQSETQNRHLLGNDTSNSPAIVAEWLLRNMRKQSKCGCSPQRRKPSEQCLGEFTESMSELSQQNPQTCNEMFNMWRQGKGLGILRQTLSEIQEIWQSTMGKWEGSERMTNPQYVVRRLTPTECSRLQNFPDGWVDIGDWVDSKGKKHKDADSPKYKALGNSLALPFWQYLADKMCKQLRNDGVEEPTMASLFSGIGGFELVFARAGAKPIWNSELDEFPEAVSRVHFGDDDTGLEGDYEQYL